MIREQTGLSCGKSCTTQVLNITQHIENDFKGKMIKGAAVFIDLTASYDTVNNGILCKNIYEMIKYPRIVGIIDILLKDSMLT